MRHTAVPLLAAPAQAAATGAVAVGTYLRYTAAGGKKNQLVVSRSGTAGSSVNCER